MKSRLITILITLIAIQIVKFGLESDACWKFQSQHFRLGEHNEVVTNVIDFNNTIENVDLSNKTLAFGNSQTRSIFLTHENNMDEDFWWTYIGAFRFSALPHFTKNIIKAKPKRLMMFISDKDLNYPVRFIRFLTILSL